VDLVQAAEKNLVVKGRKGCDAAQYGFPRDLMARDFRDKARRLAVELLGPESMPPESRPAAEYPATGELPLDVRCALDWLADAFPQLMRQWGWVDDEEREPSQQLVYEISEPELDGLRRCLTLLSEELIWHGAPPRQEPEVPNPPAKDATGKGQGEAPPSIDYKSLMGELRGLEASKPTTPPLNESRTVQIRLLDGTSGIFDPKTASRWIGRSDYDMYAELRIRVNLYRSRSGRWVTSTLHHNTDWFISCDDIVPDFWEEVTLEQAAQWFALTWEPSSDEERQSMPPEIQDQIARTDIDGPMKVTPDPIREKAPEINRNRPDRAPTAFTDAKEFSLEWRIIASYHDRLKKGANVSVRAIANEAGCSPSYVSKILKPLRPDRRGSAPRGWKDEEGSLDATA
jgi:hypothetical protein